MLPVPPEVASTLDTLIERALAEDVGAGDVTTLATVPANRGARATFLAKQAGVLAGLAVAERVFERVDGNLVVAWSAGDGDAVLAGDAFGSVSGLARSLLTAERLALNFIQRMGGIATAARRMAEAARPAVVLDTRKTAPGLRALDKWAVRLGGARSHRAGLHDMVLVKDNHIAAAGGVEPALRAVDDYLRAHGGVPVEVEVRTLDELEQVLALQAAGLRVDRLLLDNMVQRLPDGTVDTSLLRAAVARVGNAIETEASGNVTEATAGAIAATGVDYISSGALTHSVIALDVSLELELA